MSTTSHDDYTEESSSEGCGIENLNSSQNREMRKDKLKQYLKHLKQIVDSEGLSAIHISSNGNRSGTEDKRRSSNCDSDTEGNSLPVKSQEELQILVKSKGFKIMKVSGNLKRILGFPMDSWTSRHLTDFLHVKDMIALQQSYLPYYRNRYESYVMHVDDDDIYSGLEMPKRVIYCRLRRYKGLSRGFSIDHVDRYTTFQTSVSLQKVVKTEKQNQCLLLECIPIHAAYKDWFDLSSEKKTFTVRHGQFCIFSSIDPNAVPLLGFLPQDMVGKTIFDFYHPEDFEQLYNIYKQVINADGSTISSPKIRFRTYSGEWIDVKSEWACFINPWTKLVEFVICQHTVLRQPIKADVFVPSMENEENLMNYNEEYLKHVRMLRKLLREPVDHLSRLAAVTLNDESDNSTSSGSNRTDETDSE